MPDQTSAAFISYCRDDQEFALRLAQDLKAAGAAVWLDQLDIKPGSSWDNAVEDALLAAHQMLVVLTPASVKSENVRDEISYALKQGKTVIPVLYMECVIPLRLERKQHIDFRADYARGLDKLLRELHVDQPNQAVLERAAEGDAKRQRAWQAREVEAERLHLEEQTERGEAARATREETLRREQGAEAQRLEALKLQQEKDEADRLAREAEARGQRELEQQQASEQAESLVQQQVESPQPKREESKSTGSVATAKAPAWFRRKTGWMILGGIAAILIAGGVILYRHAHPPIIETYAYNCAGGDAQGCLHLGKAYEEGNHVVEDYSKAFIAYTNACELNNAEGCDELGTLYRYGVGTTQNYKLAVDSFNKACDGGSSEGCSNLASLYHETFFDYERALDAAQRAYRIDDSDGYKLKLAEANLTTAHFDTCLRWISNISYPNQRSSEVIARDVIEMACQWGSQKWADSRTAAGVLLKDTSGLEKNGWMTAGDVNFLKTSPVFKSGREAWIELFTSLQAGDSAGMTAALQKLESTTR